MGEKVFRFFLQKYIHTNVQKYYQENVLKLSKVKTPCREIALVSVYKCVTNDIYVYIEYILLCSVVFLQITLLKLLISYQNSH